MLKTLRKLFRADGHEDLQTSAGESAVFQVLYHELPVGRLTLEQETWVFEYSAEFVKQVGEAGGVQVLAEFPQVAKRYTSTELWPFFMARIPSLRQPAVQERIDEKGIDSHSSVQLLREFGKRSIANQFELVPS